MQTVYLYDIIGKLYRVGLMECIFCKIAKGELSSDFILNNSKFVVVRDVNPQAPVHMLVISKGHIETLNDLEDREMMAELVSTIRDVTKKLSIKEYRTVINTGKEAGQEIFHLHAHILSGRQMKWPPG